jgi:hypothetical protein
VLRLGWVESEPGSASSARGQEGRDSAALSEGGRCKIEGPGPIWRDHVCQGEGARGEGRSGWLGSVRYRVQASQWDRGPWDVGDNGHGRVRRMGKSKYLHADDARAATRRPTPR